MSSSMLDQRREVLFAAAEAFVSGGKTEERQRELCDAASKYHQERMAHFKGQQNQEASKLVVPFGRTKGTPIGEAETKDLQWVLGKLKENLDAPAAQRYRAKNEELIAGIERELGTR